MNSEICPPETCAATKKKKKKANAKRNKRQIQTDT